MGRLLVVRHAQSVWNAAGRWQGWSDAPLSEGGVEQARRAGRALAAANAIPALIACSDLVRARATAELIADEIAFYEALVIDADLREQDLGEWNGLTREEIDARWPGLIEARWAGRQVPGGEAGEDFTNRAMAALNRLAALEVPEAIVVAHGGVVIALERALGISKVARQHPNLSGWWVESRRSPAGLQLVPLVPVDLLVVSAQTVTDPA